MSLIGIKLFIIAGLTLLLNIFFKNKFLRYFSITILVIGSLLIGMSIITFMTCP